MNPNNLEKCWNAIILNINPPQPPQLPKDIRLNGVKTALLSFSGEIEDPINRKRLLKSPLQQRQISKKKSEIMNVISLETQLGRN